MSKILLDRRDTLIRELWSVLNQLSCVQKLKDITNEDLNLFVQVTNHSSFQKVIGQKTIKEKPK